MRVSPLSTRFRALGAIVAASATLLLGSCVGIAAEGTIKADGSGTVSVVYRVSRMVESMGKLEGNQKYLPLPIGKLDFENGLAKTSGLTLQSWSEKRTEDELRIEASVAFSSMDALGSFMDASGRGVKISKDNGVTTVSLTLTDGGSPLDPDLKNLVDAAFSDYTISLSFTLPSPPKSNENGQTAGNVVSFSSPVNAVLESDKALVWTFSW